MKRSSNARVWKPARTRTAMSLSRRPARCSASISSPTKRASSWSSHKARDAHALARLALGPQRLAEARAVVRDQARGGAQDVPGRAVIALQPHHLGAREVLLEAQDVADLGAAPAVDRLVVVADAGDVAVPLRQQPQPQVLGDVGVLVLVDQDRAEAPLVVGQDLGLLLEQASGNAAADRRNRRRSA